MVRPATVLTAIGAAVAAALAFGLVRHRTGSMGREVPGGILVGNPESYDALSHRFLMKGFFGGIAADVAKSGPSGGHVLEVGCGPGHLAIRMATEHGLEVTGLDLDPQMIERAEANAALAAGGHGPAGRQPRFRVGDVAALPFSDESFDLVVSTLSMHHWADPAAGLAEIGRVLRPGARALIWDLRRGWMPFHPPTPDPLEHLGEGPLRLVSSTPWRWPWRLALTQRMELARD